MNKRFLTIFLLSALVLSSASVFASATDTADLEPTATPEAVTEATAEPTIEPVETPEASAEDTAAVTDTVDIVETESTLTPAATTEDSAEPTATPETIIEYVYLEADDPAIWDKPFDDYTPSEGLLLLLFAGGFFAALVSVVFYKVI